MKKINVKQMLKLSISSVYGEFGTKLLDLKAAF